MSFLVSLGVTQYWNGPYYRHNRQAVEPTRYSRLGTMCACDPTPIRSTKCETEMHKFCWTFVDCYYLRLVVAGINGCIENRCRGKIGPSSSFFFLS